LSQFKKVKNYTDHNYDSDHMPPISNNSNVLMVDAGVRVTLDYDIKKQMHQPVLKQHQTKKTKLVHLGQLAKESNNPSASSSSKHNSKGTVYNNLHSLQMDPVLAAKFGTYFPPQATSSKT